ncbi:Crp/Fnr family transcriptional regulator [Chitinophaga sancti]|uniref:Crp/Fnr family transcriptional regulator n=1 Tax=Chitinophaga sancti TaxID=1004 RepID=A0A1K1MW07_9BACT|nr:Crp/Fnr family transcriptional regulator [Chitinophaga sancti]WQD63036.1 Crp/Fnr family transcriptional regulator [Chitinophaga sancti]WQG91339.1 Crp/Fnr family transcriptional regulator [Chitinophaga sancti]SFW27299.1 cAMP-binding domain of CRP or a regulatory subunit of cAMP-dependent protein kinases [Chitinophaga sancti]
MSLKGIFPIDKWIFRSRSIMESLSKEEMERLLSDMVEQEYKKGQIIFRENNPAFGIYYIKQGKVKKYKQDRNGNEHIIYVANEGELIGYHPVLAGSTYPDSAAALEDSRIAFIPRESFLSAMEWAPGLTKHLLSALSYEYSVLANSLSIVAKHSVRERLAISLIVLREKYKVSAQDTSDVSINISRKDLASMTATTEENVVRILKELKEEGIVGTQGRKIIIHDVKALVEMAHYQ